MPSFDLEDWIAEHKAGCYYSFGSSDVEPIALSEVLAATDLAQWGSTQLAYCPSRGSGLLRERVADLYTTLSAELIHTFNGATEAIFALLNVLVAPGDEVVVLGPTYQLLSDLPAALGARVTRVDLQYRTREAWSLDIDAVEAAITPATTLVVANLPNPTGYLPTPAEYQRIAGVAARHGAWFVNDEIYRGLEFPPNAQLPAAADLFERGVSIGSMSKTLGMPGIRIGWVACRDAALMDAVRTFRYWSSLSNNVLGEALAIAGFDRYAKLIHRARTLVAAGRTAVQTFASAHSESIDHVETRAATTLMLGLRTAPATEIAVSLVKKHSVYAVPASVLNLPDTQLRVGLGRANLEYCLDALDSVLNDFSPS